MNENREAQHIRRRIMVLGAGIGQLPAIQKALDMGFWVIAVDRDPKAPGMGIANESVAIDIKDKDEVYKAAKGLSIDGVLTLQSDVAVPTVGYVAEMLGLPGIRHEDGLAATDKRLMAERFQSAGVPTPRTASVEMLEDARNEAGAMGYPVVVKAPDSSGSRGVTRVNGPDGMTAAFHEAKKYSGAGHVLVQEFVDGVEIGAQGFANPLGEDLMVVHNDMVSPPPYHVPIGHSLPAQLSEDVLRRVEDVGHKAVKALNITNGPSNLDFILKPNGDPVVLEVGARLGATCLPELLEYSTGIDWIKASIQAALGDAPDLERTRTVPCAVMILESPVDGILKGWQIPEEARTQEHVLEVEIEAAVGDVVHMLRKGTDRVGKVVTKGNDLSEAERLAYFIRDRVRLQVEPDQIQHVRSD